MAQEIQLRRGTAATWTSVNPILAQGEPGVEDDTLRLKVGDGSTHWTSLAYICDPAGTAQTLAAQRTRTATVTIAPANASTSSKAAADFVCTGTSTTGGDETTFALAVAALPSTGGSLVILEGTLWRTNPLVCDKNYTYITGQGIGGTQISPASNAAGVADMVVGDQSQPQNTRLENLQFYDGNSGFTPFAGSQHGLIWRANNGAITNVYTSRTALDGIRLEGFRAFGAATTLTANVTSTPVPGTVETWNIASNASLPSVPFYAQIGVVGKNGDATPEIVKVTATTSTTATVERGYGGHSVPNTSANSYLPMCKTHTSGDAFTSFTPTVNYDNLVYHCYAIFPNRYGYVTDTWISDYEMLDAKVNGGGPTVSQTANATITGFYMVGGGGRFLVCHPYFCNGYGMFADGLGIPANPSLSIVSGEWESNGFQGVFLRFCKGVGLFSLLVYGNEAGHISCTSVNQLTIAGIQDTQGGTPNYKGLGLYSCSHVDVSGWTSIAVGTNIYFLASGCNYVRFHHNDLSGCGSGSNAMAMQLLDTSSSIVDHNTVDGSIMEAHGSGTSPNGNTVSDNTILQPAIPNLVLGPPSVWLLGASSTAQRNTKAAFLTETSSAANITSGNTTVVVDHGLGTALTVADASGGTGSATLTSASKAFLPSVTAIPAGASAGAAIPVTGTNIPDGTTIISAAADGSTITLSQTPTGTVSGVKCWTNPVLPDASRITITPQTGVPITGGTGGVWVSNVTSTTFTLNVAATSASTVTVGWAYRS